MKYSQLTAVMASFGFFASVASPVMAEETRQHGKHEHGTAELMLAVEGDQLQISLESPGFNLVGFGQPKDEKQHEEVEHAHELLNKPTELFALDAAGCTVVSTEVEGSLFDEDHDGEHHDEHHDDEHADEHADEHDGEHHDDEHDKEHEDEHHDDEHHDDEHAKDEHHDEHDDHDEDGHEGEGHSDVMVQWTLQCENLEQMQQLQVNLFEQFEHLEKLDVQYLTAQKQGAQTLSADQATLQF